MYRVGIEALLGITLREGALHIDPCIPRTWPGYEVHFKAPRAEYRIVVENPQGVNRGVHSVEIDGAPVASAHVALATDGRTHHVRVVMGAVQ
jgi:cyclic beta-1,2-glucan synthetase